MKRTTLIMVAAAALVFAFASVALAIGPAYISWDAGGPNAGSAGTPHTDYQLTTEKCAVCHSVHAARNGMTAQPGVNEVLSGDAELLLRGPAADACTFCHISTAIGSKQVYNGIPAAYNQVDELIAHNGPPGGSSSAACGQCHAVHGANTMAGAKEDKILKNYVVRAYQAEITADYGGNAAIQTTSTGDAQVSAFCTGCHKTYSTASETSITVSGYWSPTTSYQVGVTMKHHPLKAAETTFTAQGSTTTTTVAWIDSSYCRSCHSAGNVDAGPGIITSSFPHYTPLHANFLDAATDAVAATATVASPAADGVCLRCHRDGAGNGVNLSY